MREPSREDRCPECGASEVEANTPRTVYGCGSSDYDQRPGSFTQSETCQKNHVPDVGKMVDNPM